MKKKKRVSTSCKTWVKKLAVFIIILSVYQIVGDMNVVKASSNLSETRTLNYADSPADNPIKGFAPFRGISYDFPSSLEYISLPLSDIVEGEKTYNWTKLEEALNQIASSGRQSIVSFYMDYPKDVTDEQLVTYQKMIEAKTSNEREEKKALLDNELSKLKVGIPEYLRNTIKGDYYAMGSTQTSGSDLGFSPFYNQDEIWIMVEDFVKELGAKYDGDPRIATVEASVVGIWGEWHTAPYDKEDTDATDGINANFLLDDSNLYQLAKTYDNAFNQTQVTIRYPKAGTNQLNVGYSDYSFCHESIVDAWSQLNLLENNNATEYWKKNIGGGELYPGYVNEMFENPEWCKKTGESYMECIQALHPSWLLVGNIYGFSNAEREEAIKAARKLGYDFTVTQATFANNIIDSTDKMNVSLKVKNIGTAPFYYKWKVKMGVLDEKGKLIKSYGTNWDITQIAADGNEYTFAGALPNLALETGKYSLAIYVENPLVNGKKLRFANETQRADGWMVLGDFTVNGYKAEEVNVEDPLPTAREKYSIGVSATEFPEARVITSDYMYFNVRIRNYGTSDYTGVEFPVMRFYKDGELVKEAITNWDLLRKDNPVKEGINSENHSARYGWGIKGLGIGEYDVSLQLTADTAEVSLGKTFIVNSLDEMYRIDDQLIDLIPTSMDKYGLSVTATDYPAEVALTNDYYKVGVRIQNNGNSNYTGTEHPVMRFYKDGALVKETTTNWDLTTIDSNTNNYYCWFVKGLEVGEYEISLQITTDTTETSLGKMKVINAPEEQKCVLDVSATDFPAEVTLTNDYYKVGVRIQNSGNINYAGTENPIMRFYKDGVLVKERPTNWNLSEIDPKDNNYYCWNVQGLELGEYEIKLQITSDMAETSLGKMKVVEEQKCVLDVSATDFPAEVTLTNDYYKIGVRIQNNGNINYTGTENPIMRFYKDGVLVKEAITNWNLTEIAPKENNYYCWFVKGLEGGEYEIKLQITTDISEVSLGKMKVIN